MTRYPMTPPQQQQLLTYALSLPMNEQDRYGWRIRRAMREHGCRYSFKPRGGSQLAKEKKP